jgi:molecular chaperone DnaJ
MKDYYKTLGVDKNASQDEIKKAFRKLAHEHHPDKKTGNEAKFKEAGEAYAVLSDEAKRKQYDTYGSAGPGMGSGQGGYGGAQDFGGFDFSGFGGGQNFADFDLGDIFGEFFGGGRGESRQKRGRDIQVDLDLDFSESIFGADKKIRVGKNSTCSTCKGSGGKPGTDMKTCGTCHGKGKVEEIRRTMFGGVRQIRSCDHCHGTGKIPAQMCSECKGAGISHKQEEYTVTIPSGVEAGQTLRLPNAGEAIQGGNPGDLFIKIRVKPHKHFQKDGFNLVTEIPMKLTQALTGDEVKLETLDGEIMLKIPEGANHGNVLRVKGKGVPHDKYKRGDLMVHLNLKMPGKLSKAAAKLVEELKKEGI